MPGAPVRSGLAHALAWTGWGAAAALVAQHPLPPSTLALFVAVSATVAGGCLLLAPRRSAREVRMRALAMSIIAMVGAAVVSALHGDFRPELLAPWVAGAAGMHSRATMAAAAADPSPGVRIAPTLLALAAGAALVAAATALGLPSLAVLLAITALQVGAVALVLRMTAAAEGATATESTTAAPPARLLPLLVLAAAGATALVALRPTLSAIGAEDARPAGPIALTLLVGGLAGPPLARLVERLGLGRGGALLATIGGVAALVAPIARPGPLDLVAAAVLGVALAAAAALAELARRSGVAVRPRGAAVLLLAGALGAIVAGLLLSAVPVPDVVLGAAIACLVAGLGAWAPAPRDRVARG